MISDEIEDIRCDRNRLTYSKSPVLSKISGATEDVRYDENVQLKRVNDHSVSISVLSKMSGAIRASKIFATIEDVRCNRNVLCNRNVSGVIKVSGTI